MDYNQLTKDFNQRYSESWVWLTFPDGREHFVYLVEARLEDSHDFPYLTIRSEELGENKIKYSTNYALKFKRPPIGVFNWGRGAYVIQRSINLTYSKGVSKDTYQVSSVVGNIHPKVGSEEICTISDRWGNIVAESYKSKYYPMETALAMLKKGTHRSVALSNRVSVALSHSDAEQFGIYYYYYFVGFVDQHGKPLFDNSLFNFPELNT